MSNRILPTLSLLDRCEQLRALRAELEADVSKHIAEHRTAISQHEHEIRAATKALQELGCVVEVPPAPEFQFKHARNQRGGYLLPCIAIGLALVAIGLSLI